MKTSRNLYSYLLLAAIALVCVAPTAGAQNFMEPQQNDPQLATYVSKTEASSHAKVIEAGAVVYQINPQPNNLSVVMQAIGYPIKAREAGVQGTVLLAVQVDGQGKVVQARVLRSPNELLTAAVMQHVHTLQFAPGSKGGQPATLWVQVPLRFRLF